MKKKAQKKNVTLRLIFALFLSIIQNVLKNDEDSFPKKTLSLSLSLRETERRWYAQQRRERQQNSLSLVLSSSSSSSSEENNLLIASVSAREGERCNFFARRQKKL